MGSGPTEGELRRQSPARRPALQPARDSTTERQEARHLLDESGAVSPPLSTSTVLRWNFSGTGATSSGASMTTAAENAFSPAIRWERSNREFSIRTEISLAASARICGNDRDARRGLDLFS